ncbi:carbohydrate ABC transporter membrane protein 2, CUT1 family [Anaerovirgula multivorans]|uniref:Carbohydrate ABC transporter membrane protein 2, CUT1 family n=1 Tax=Anaerovirgula multivorans TaxID=312168 RepID=A0A239II40_9FIRM|nr:carbohydrate ABC transporter permease [Anaerovirgula multivorans]SNS93416.1 carbohydrate ABC transporter membrane protein 2, CUT1 family [Anaerovirgula multivorans]
MGMSRHIKRRFGKIVLSAMLFIMVTVFLFPLILTITNSFMSEQEIETSYSMVISEDSSQQNNAFIGEYANVKLIPDMVTVKQYYTALIKRTQFLIKFWNSGIIVIPIILGQILVSSMAAYAFAKINFAFRDKLFFTYIIIMMMPFQVTLVPNYIMASRLGLVGNYLSIILPGIFGTFGVFLMRQFMVHIPDAYIEAAKVDGATHFKIFFSIILPMSKTALAALSILVFIDNWNMVEQPLIFLQDVNMHPLSVYLSNINQGEMGIAFAASTIYMLPMLLIFLYGENYLVEGIQRSGLKD